MSTMPDSREGKGWNRLQYGKRRRWSLVTFVIYRVRADQGWRDGDPQDSMVLRGVCVNFYHGGGVKCFTKSETRIGEGYYPMG